MADMDRDVIVVTTEAKIMMRKAKPMPACATTHEIRMNSITPQMFSKHRICSDERGSENGTRTMAYSPALPESIRSVSGRTRRWQ